jgi:hypothetical protein
MKANKAILIYELSYIKIEILCKQVMSILQLIKSWYNSTTSVKYPANYKFLMNSYKNLSMLKNEKLNKLHTNLSN